MNRRIRLRDLTGEERRRLFDNRVERSSAGDEAEAEDWIMHESCGGGRRIIRKKVEEREEQED